MSRRGKRVRADQLLVERGLCEDEHAARARIMAGSVFARDARGREHRVDKAGELLESSDELRVAGAAHPYVSRGGLKLAHALDRFAIDPQGLVCADIGISTGGFTDCLLARGAARVHGVDVGYGQTAWRIRSDPRVILHERTNARQLAAGAFGEKIDLLVADLSFIGLRGLMPALAAQLGPGAGAVLLVKPQFELPADEVGPGGIVTGDAARRRAVERVREAARQAGFEPIAEADSPIAGADGNREIFLYLTRQDP